METEEEKSNTEKSNSTLGIIILVVLGLVLVGILYNDLIDIPRKNKEYQESCYYFSFALYNTGDSNSYKRNLFISCLEDLGEINTANAYKCWQLNSPETLENSYNINSCPNDLYSSSKILF